MSTCNNRLWGTQLLYQAGVTHRPSLLEDVVIMSTKVLRWHEVQPVLPEGWPRSEIIQERRGVVGLWGWKILSPEKKL